MELKKFFQKIGRYAILFGAGLVLYIVVNKITTGCMNIQMDEYYGLDEMTSISVKGLIKGFVYSYLYFFRYFFTTIYHTSAYIIVVNDVITVVFAICVCGKLQTMWKNAQKSRVFINVCLLFLIPPAMVSMPLLMADRVGAGVDRYSMYSVVYMAVLILITLASIDSEKTKKCLQYACTVALFGIAVNYADDYFIVNRSYARMDANQNAINDYMNRMVYRMEELENWNPEKTVLFSECGVVFTEYYEQAEEEQIFVELPMMRGTEFEPIYAPVAFKNYMNARLHFPIQIERDEDTIANIKASAEYKAMPIYPLDGSLQVIDDVLVIKFQ